MNDHIKDYWQNQGESFHESHEASWGDKMAIELEIKNISNFINVF